MTETGTGPDPAAILKPLIACRSVTPADGGALAYLARDLGDAGFKVERLAFSAPGTADVVNLFATIGAGPPHLVFAGHTDVVPPGDETRWTHPPFAGEIEGGAAYRPRRRRHEGRHRAFIAAALGHLRAKAAGRADALAAHHRRRGRAGDQRHRQAARLGEPARQPLRRGAGRRADLRRRGSATRSRSAGAAACRARSASSAGRATSPIRTSPTTRSTRPDPHPRPADHGEARRGQRRFPAVEPRSDQHRRRQPRLQRHPGRGAGALQCPLQRPLDADGARGAAQARTRRRGRRRHATSSPSSRAQANGS